jgi:hypothetical protein
MKLSVNTNISSVFALAFKDQSIEEKELNKFITEFKRLYERINSKESEENQKNIIADFLKDVYYKPNYEVNTKGRIDLAIHNGKSAKDSVGVIIEAKKPSNKSEMATAEKPNVKAFQEILLYYLDERIKGENLEIKHLIITNIADWFIIDAQDFEKIITKEIIKSYKSFTEGALVNENNVIFYNEIAKNFFDKCTTDLPCTKVNLEIINKLVNSENEKDIEELTHYYKLLSPQHLLKLRFANDSNKLNNDFYNELLHIIGLKETADGGKKIIDRKPEKDRNDGSLIENTITILKNRNKLQNINNLEQFGETEEKQLFSVGLELCITWLNRILFLKLLEGQLIKYNNDDREAFSFLNSDKIKDFDELDELFFEVLAIKTEDRPKEITKKFGNIPYLNSSLFEQTELEQKVLEINGIKDRYELEIFNSTVLKDGDKRKTGTLSTLKYLFDFLDSYDFASDNKQKVQKERKTIINASVLGLIFEKINGYKDGSFYTPGFITEYMCRETIRKAVIQKFNDAQKWEHDNWNELQRAVIKLSVEDANKIINEVRICDPAVGSGHFLVSALNEMIAIKQDLQIFEHDKNGPFRGLTIKIENDELVTRLNGELFQYNYKDENSQRIQETLFKEKRTVIENCLFGVDINPKSVMICQLRLWIELLKNAYYIQDKSGKPINKELQTLPNIDINIKCGNSLVSRFKVRDGFFENSTKFKTKFNDYKIWVNLYKDTNDKKAKAELSKKIDAFKTEFKNIESTDIKAKQKKIDDLAYQLYNKYNTDQLFGSELTDKQIKEKNKLESDLQKLIDDKNESLNNPLYGNALEWRFEFPEVLNEDGGYLGFDAIIGNPPYIVIKGGRYTGYEFNSDVIKFLKENYVTGEQQINTYTLFIEQSKNLCSDKGVCSFIVPNTFLANEYSTSLRNFLLSNFSIYTLNNVGIVFDDASVETIIVSYGNIEAKQTLIKNKEDEFSLNLKEISELTEDKKFLILLNESKYKIIRKINSYPKLSKYAKVWRGLTTGNDKKFISGNKTQDTEKPLITGSEISRYGVLENKKYVNYLPDELDRARDERIFLLNEKLISKFVGNRLTFTFDNNQFYVLNSGCVTELINSEIGIKCLLGILNSKLLNFYFSNVFTDYRETFPIMKSGNVENLPIIVPSISIQNQITDLADDILNLKIMNSIENTIELEKQIDDLVYKLYNLTPEEIAIVEENTKK